MLHVWGVGKIIKMKRSFCHARGSLMKRTGIQKKCHTVGYTYSDSVSKNHRNAVEGSANTLHPVVAYTHCLVQLYYVHANCLAYTCTVETGASLASGEV
jgi:hypothetical protein